MGVSQQQVEAGQAVYTKRVLYSYDLLVLGFSNRLLWKCPSRRIEQLYNRLVTSNHLDVGIGTGYFLDRCHFPTKSPRLALMDLNPNALDFCARRLARYTPATHRRNVLEPIPFDAPAFDSIGVNYLLHCLPGAIESKAVVFDHLRPLMNPGAVLFGSTLVQGDAPRNWAARRLMALYNKKGIFSNGDDHLDALRAALTTRFRDVSIELIGCAAVFSARA